MGALIFVIRHGETRWSLAGRHTGRTDVALTENGERQASGFRRRFKGITFTHVLTSPLRRARRTCELAGLGAEAKVQANLHEWDYGDYEGRKTSAIRVRRPGWNVFRDGCPHGESVAQISRRADLVLAGLRAMDGTIALFSHGEFLRVLAMRWVGLPAGAGRHFTLDAAAFGVLGYEHGDVPAISLWNSRNFPMS